MNVTRYFNLWRMKPGKHVMITNEYGVLDIIKEKFDNINIVEYKRNRRSRGQSECKKIKVHQRSISRKQWNYKAKI